MKTVTEEQFLSMINMVAAKHGGKVHVDFESKTIDMDIPVGNEVASADEVEKLFGEYAC